MSSARNACVVSLALGLAAAASGADIATLKCEGWHLRLGQIADRTAVIDFAAKTCAAEPCTISDAAFKWNELNGRSDVAVNRATGEGTSTYQGEVATNLKNCKLVTGKS